MTVWQQFKRIVRDARCIENLNAGGCGIFAEHLYLWLTSLGIKCQIVILTRTPDACKEANNNGRNGNSWVSTYHVLIRLPDYRYVDSCGISKKKYKLGGFLKAVPVSYEYLKWLNKNNGWCQDFNRRTGIPQIQELFIKQHRYA